MVSTMNTLNRDMILAYLRANKQLLEKEFGLTQIALFGSFARNEAHRTSDIDLLIELKKNDFTTRFYLKEHLEKQFKRKVDLGYFKSIRLAIRQYVEEDLIYA